MSLLGHLEVNFECLKGKLLCVPIWRFPFSGPVKMVVPSVSAVFRPLFCHFTVLTPCLFFSVSCFRFAVLGSVSKIALSVSRAALRWVATLVHGSAFAQIGIAAYERRESFRHIAGSHFDGEVKHLWHARELATYCWLLFQLWSSKPQYFASCLVFHRHRSHPSQRALHLAHHQRRLQWGRDETILSINK